MSFLLMLTIAIFIFLCLGAIAVFVLAQKSTITIGQNEYGIVFKHNPFNLFSRSLPSHQKIALNGENGYQADILSPGPHRWYWSWMYTIHRKPLIRIPQGEIALVVAKDGQSVSPGRKLGRMVECNDFQDARAFLTSGGQRGEQLGILTAGEYRINTELFDVITRANARQHGMDPEKLRVYTVGHHQVGIVTTLVGKSLPDDETAAPSIPEGYNDFQNGQRFIGDNPEGYKGLQVEVLKSGSYELNPWFVEVVKQVPTTYVPPGAVGVVLSHIGKMPENNGDNDLVEPGYKGIQKIPLMPRRYNVNTGVQNVILVPTTPIVLDWSNKTKDPSNYDADLKPINLISKDGFSFKIEVTQEIKIEPGNAPKVILEFGIQGAELTEMANNNYYAPGKFTAIRTLVTKVLKPTIEMYFRNAATGYEMWDFHVKKAELAEEAKRAIEMALSIRGIRAIDTVINEIDLPPELEKHLIDRMNIKQNILTLIEQEQENMIRYPIEKQGAEHLAIIEEIKNWPDAKKIQSLAQILGVQEFLRYTEIQQLPYIKFPETIVGEHGLFGELIGWSMGGRPKPPSITQEQISQFVDTLGGYLKEGGAEKVRDLFYEKFSFEPPRQIDVRPEEGKTGVPKMIPESSSNITFEGVETIPSKSSLIDETGYDNSVYIQPIPESLNWSEWGVAGASVQGTSHIKSGIPCQDTHGYNILDNHTIIVATADGLGSASKARQGAKIAVEKTLSSLSRALQTTPNTEIEWQQIVRESFEKTCSELASIAKEEDLPSREYGTTLITAILTDNWLVTGHIGDGAVVALFEDGKWETVCPPVRTEYANQTVSLTQDNALQLAKFSTQRAKVKALAILSDGLQHLCLNNSDNKPVTGFFTPFFKELPKIVNSAVSQEASNSVAEFLASHEQICAKTDDDKTLVLVGRKAK